MATLCRAYPSEAAARRAIADLRAAGLPPQGAQLITGSPPHDLRHEPVGKFVGRAGPQAPVRTFGNTTVRRWQAPGGFAGEPDRMREGSFADADSNRLVQHDPTGRAHAHVAGVRGLRSLLLASGVEPAAAEHALAQARAGASLVLVQVASIGPDDVAARLDAPGRAA